LKQYKGGSFYDVLREVYKVSEEDIPGLVEKY
jgi:hypothetical protein